MRLRKILITVDPQSEEILKAYRLSGLSASYIIREALKRYHWQVKPKAQVTYEGVDAVEYD